MKRYSDINQRVSNSGRRYRVNPIYPSIPLSENDTYVITVGGDRYDTLAHEFYNDSRLWWVIASANNADRDTINITPGTQLRIPYNITAVLSQFRDFNNSK